jgi:hypothetical protein
LAVLAYPYALRELLVALRRDQRLELFGSAFFWTQNLTMGPSGVIGVARAFRLYRKVKGAEERKKTATHSAQFASRARGRGNLPRMAACWAELVERFRALAGDESAIRAERRGLDLLNACCSEQLRLVQRAASTLPTKGPDAESIAHALAESAFESPEHGLAVCALVHRRVFPKYYLRAFVRSAARKGSNRCRQILETASAAYGIEPVLRALVESAPLESLEYERLRLLLYYVRPSNTERGPLTATEYDLIAELIRITSNGSVRWRRPRPPDRNGDA